MLIDIYAVIEKIVLHIIYILFWNYKLFTSYEIIHIYIFFYILFTFIYAIIIIIYCNKCKKYLNDIEFIILFYIYIKYYEIF